ncbi:tyrosine--tRNA ligase [Fenollaria timonensis]|uniref:tyrosine--tRNA ligase n=1 Tax=Fenollaria timonensis TaxID=1723384 RepID=UPI00071E0AA6|nr:tyrosine--tRNA ligase [Fenollaria timonensis]
MNVFDVLKERGYIDNCNYEDELRNLLNNEKITFYTGYDATANSLTIGHYITLMVMKHLQAAGHRAICLTGGATTMIGDPSGKQDMRKLLTEETINENARIFVEQLSRFIDFSDGKALHVDNKEWLRDLRYLDFMRDIGVNFNVSKMLAYDCYKNRISSGLTFFEMGYMLMQAYDFLELYRKYGCVLQVGGSDQWANMLEGTELINKLEGKQAYVMTLKLLTNADGVKMGKTVSGAVWLDREKTTPYELFQYFRNVDDRDVIKFLKLLTMLPMEEINELAKLKDNEINKAKEILAYEITKDVHSKEDADKALEASRALFSGNADSENIPSTTMDKKLFEDGIGLLNLLKELNLTKSNSEARQLISQGGILLNGEKESDASKVITLDDFKDGELLIKKGKKVFHKVIY